jgi:hypothetical protein
LLPASDDDDKAIERMFVRFLGDRALYRRYRDETKAARAKRAGPDYGLSEFEQLAIWIYSCTKGSWHQRINSELWRGPCSVEVSMLTHLLSRALTKIPPCTQIVYRGYLTEDIDGFLPRYAVGARVIWPAFTSSTLVPEKAYEGNILFTIRSQSGRTIATFSEDPSQEEVLFPCGCHFQINSVERREDDALLELEECRP